MFQWIDLWLGQEELTVRNIRKGLIKHAETPTRTFDSVWSDFGLCDHFCFSRMRVGCDMRSSFSCAFFLDAYTCSGLRMIAWASNWSIFDFDGGKLITGNKLKLQG